MDATRDLLLWAAQRHDPDWPCHQVVASRLEVN
jgi:hypothetical protein